MDAPVTAEVSNERKTAGEVIVEAARARRTNKYIVARHLGGTKFRVVERGSSSNSFIKKGDVISSSDLDDLQNQGHKIKELKKFE